MGRFRCSIVILMAAFLAAAGCDKLPLLAPTNSTITLFAAQTVLPLNGSTEVVATVVESAGTPVQNGTVVTFTTTLGSIEPREARTDAGKVTVRFNSGGQSGTAEIKAVSGGATVKDALKIDIGAAVADNVQLTATPGSVSSLGGTVLLSATVTDKNGNRVSGVPVGFSADVGTLGSQNVITDFNGQAITTLTTTRATKVTARAGAKSAEITVGVNATAVITVTALPTTASSTQPVTITLAPGTNVTGPITNVRLDYGDGSSESNITVAGTITRQRQYCAPTTYAITATGTDINGERATGSASVAVSLPTLTLTGPPAASVRQAVTFTAVVSTGAVITRYEWDFGDGHRESTIGPSNSRAYSAQGGYPVRVTAISSLCGTVTTGTTSINIGP